MKSKKAKMFLETWQTKLRGVPVNSHDDAVKAVEMAEEEMKQNAIEIVCPILANCEGVKAEDIVYLEQQMRKLL